MMRIVICKFGYTMKKVTIISLALLLAACSSDTTETQVSTDSYQEDYQRDEMPKPVSEQVDLYSSEAEVSSANEVEPEVTTKVAASQEKKTKSLSPASTSSVGAKQQPAPAETKKVVKLTPKSQTEDSASSSSVRVFYPQASEQDQPNNASYVLQVLAAETLAEVSNLAHKLPQEGAKWSNYKRINKKDWYGLVYGEFASVAEARAAIATLPREFRQAKPFVRSVKSIKESDYPILKPIK